MFQPGGQRLARWNPDLDTQARRDDLHSVSPGLLRLNRSGFFAATPSPARAFATGFFIGIHRWRRELLRGPQKWCKQEEAGLRVG